MAKSARIAIFVISAALLLLVILIVRSSVSIQPEASVVMFSSLLMLSFVTLFLEHWFTTPTDVIASAISILLILAPLNVVFASLGALYYLFFGYNLLLLTTSLAALLLLDQELPFRV